jgi:hypothetical protein
MAYLGLISAATKDPGVSVRKRAVKASDVIMF